MAYAAIILRIRHSRKEKQLVLIPGGVYGTVKKRRERRGCLLKIGLCQLEVTADKERNLRRAGELLRRAAEGGAELSVLPEMFNCPYDNACFPAYAEETGGRTWQFLSEIARETGVTLVGGSVPEREGGHIYNTSYVFSGKGVQLGRHRKLHLFNVEIAGGQRFLESDTLTAGDDITVLDTPQGRIGVAICFDIRFGELFRVMGQEGAGVIVVPAAFNMTTGPAHWDLSFRMRALDNQCFTVGCAPARREDAGYVSYAHSIVCNPWGEIVARMGTEEGVMVVEIDGKQREEYRAQIPILTGRRTDLYDTVCRAPFLHCPPEFGKIEPKKD